MHFLNTYTFLLASILLIISGPSHAQRKTSYESEELRMRLTPRSPQQMTAFYEGRGFSKKMLAEIRNYCFITVYIRNKHNDIIWHDLNNWRFITAEKSLTRIDREKFKTLWQKMGISLSHQSTFRWTLLPEQLDFRPNEREGGNIVLPRSEKPITINATFKIGNDKSGKSIAVKINNLSCKK